MIRDVSTLILSTKCLLTEFDISEDLRFREPAPLPCKFPNVCQHLVAESTFVSRPCLCRVVCRRVVELVGPPTAFPVWAPVYRGCPCRDPPVCHRVQGDSVAKRQPFCVLIGVVTSCVLCARVRGRVSRSCATENTDTPARLEALFKLSVITILRHLYRSLRHFCGLWVLFPTRHLVRDRTFLACCLQCRTPSRSRKCKSVSFTED